MTIDLRACLECAGKNKGIWIFVDDSNIWIEAKKLKGKQKGFKTEDPRVRIDVGKLADQIAADRPVAEGVLFGSEPPSVDSVWEKIREKKNWHVRLSNRSTITKKEKQVDTKLVAEVTAKAIKTPKHERTTIVLVTGDADMIPAVDQVLKEEGWKIEIYMWKQSKSHGFNEYKDNDRVDIKLLDDLKDFTFTNMKFNLKPSNLGNVKENAVVLTMQPNAFRSHIPTERWCEKLEKITQWPFQHYWFKVEDERTDDLVIVLSNFESKKNDLNFLEQIKHLDNVKEAETFLQYIHRIHQKYTNVESLEMEQTGVYSEEDVSNWEESNINSVTDEMSSVKVRRKENKQKYSDQCTNQFNCPSGTGCTKKHKEEEKEYFRIRKYGRGNPLRKVKCCTYFQTGSCKKLAKECEFAHGDADAWCLRCRLSSGHYTDNCPKKLQ